MSSDSVHRYVIAYDVASDTRRTRVAKTLESYGDRIQFSVFLVAAKPAKMLRLRATIINQLLLSADSVLICDVGTIATSRSRSLDYVGATRPITGTGPMVI